MLHLQRKIMRPPMACIICMMTSSNGNIFRVTGPLCQEFTGPGEFPTQRIWDAIVVIMTSMLWITNESRSFTKNGSQITNTLNGLLYVINPWWPISSTYIKIKDARFTDIVFNEIKTLKTNINQLYLPYIFHDTKRYTCQYCLHIILTTSIIKTSCPM